MPDSWTWKKISWSLRKIRLPIKSGDLVLDVGSGGNPHPSADVLLEKYLNKKHRFEGEMVVDRPSVLADACKMPFRNKAFDFVVAFHVLEHMKDPQIFLMELQRVAKAGYIETPNAIFERLIPYDVHLSEVIDIDDTLIIYKKNNARPDAFLNNIDLVKKSKRWYRLFYNNPDLFHVRYFWKDNINFKVLNPDTSTDWFSEPEADLIKNKIPIERQVASRSVRSQVLKLLRKWYQFRKKNKTNLLDLLVCPNCHGEFMKENNKLHCIKCNLVFSTQGIPDFINPLVGK